MTEVPPQAATAAVEAGKTAFQALKDGSKGHGVIVTLGTLVLAKGLWDAVGQFRKKEDEQGNPIHRNGIVTSAAEIAGGTAFLNTVMKYGRGAIQTGI